MEVRDAVEDDAEVLASLADVPTDVVRNVIHDRTVRVAETDDEGATPLAFVSFDASPDTVYVTQLAGELNACEDLLQEPIRFARGEAMAVEILIAEDDAPLRVAADRSGFDEVGRGPRFDGTDTIRYRLETGDGGDAAA